jgi:uncharacterized protein (DUF362 family)
MHRRAFCRTVSVLGGSLLAAPLLQACARAAPATQVRPTPAAALPTRTPGLPATATTALGLSEPLQGSPTTEAPPAPGPTPAPSATAVPGSKVALIKTADRAQGVRRALEVLGVNPARGNRVLLKPNLNSADEAPGSTHPDVLRALVTALNDLGARAVTVADRSGMGNTRAVMERTGVLALAQELGFAAVVLDELAAEAWVVRESTDHHWQRGFAVPRLLLDAECVVQTCNLKTHRFGGHFTLSLKNSVGLAAKRVPGERYDYMTELHGSPYQRHLIAEINTAYAPALIVMDGVEAFVQGGPDRGEKARAEVVLAGTDRVAVDAVGVAILRLLGTTPEVSRGRVFEQEQIARAVELGLGVASPAQIELAADDAEGEAYAARIREVLAA